MVYFIIFLLIILLLFFPLEIQTSYRRKADDDLLLFKIIIIPKFIIIRYEIPIIQLKGSKIPTLKVKSELEHLENDLKTQKMDLDFSWENIRHFLENFLPYYKLIQCYFKSGKLFFRPWILKSFSWQTNFGTGDAAATGITCGVLWSAKYLLWQNLASIFRVNTKPVLAINPDFNQQKLEMEIDGIFACRLGNIIIAAFKALNNLRKCRK